MKIFTTSLRALERDLAAAAFAEAGEFETAREMRKGEKRVLLVLGGHPTDRQALQYAVSFCSRMGTSLEILGDAKSAATVKAFASELEQKHIGYTVTLTEGNLQSAAAELTRRNTHIDYVIVNSQGISEKSSRKGPASLAELQRSFSCPLIVVGS
jgi:siroheme synthase